MYHGIFVSCGATHKGPNLFTNTSIPHNIYFSFVLFFGQQQPHIHVYVYEN